MDFSSVFDISSAGMNLQRVRLEVTAANLANAQTTSAGGGAYRPLLVVARATTMDSFEMSLASAGSTRRPDAGGSGESRLAVADRLRAANPICRARPGTPRMTNAPPSA